MFTRSGRPYGTGRSNKTSQDDRIQELIQQMSAMNKKIDFLYGRGFDKPEGSSNHNKEGET
jgi:hypothetical protein